MPPTPPPAGPSSKPACAREDALAVLLRLREAGHVAYFAGGCVRDELLGLAPKDYDVATDAPPPRVRELFSSTQAVGQAFGVILVRHRRSVVEVATFRADLAYTDGRRPEGVRFTTAQEDAKRRDFTINGLFLDPLENCVIDYVGGQEDLRRGILRAIGNADERFDEDHLRLLRAVRFAARFSLSVEESTHAALARHGPQLVRISPERVAEELRAMLTPPTRARAWEMLRAYALDDVIYRFLRLPDAAPEKRDVRLMARVAEGEPIPFGLALAAGTLEWALRRTPPDLQEWPKLLAPTGLRQMTKAVRQALRVSNEESDAMEGTLEGVASLLAAPPPGVAKLKRFLTRPTASLSRALLAALAGAGLVPEEQYNSLHDQLEALERTEYAPPPLITGDDLTAAGLRPGPAFKRVLDAVYDAQLEGRVGDKAGAMELALTMAGSPA